MNLWLKEVDIQNCTDNYDVAKIPREERLCQICKNKVEDEKHFIFKCILYDVERKNLELWFNSFLNVDFFGLNMEQKL